MKEWVIWLILTIAVYGGLLIYILINYGTDDLIILLLVLFGLIIYPLQILWERKHTG